MGQIVKRKKKGRPSKADLARRGTHSPAEKAAEPDRRRSLRRRNVRYNNFIDFDDYLDEEFEGEDEEEEEEEDEGRREKKLKLVLKLNNNRGARGGHAGVASSSSASEEDNDGEEESGRKPLKKRRINDSEVEEEEEEESENGEDLKSNDNNISHQEVYRIDRTDLLYVRRERKWLMNWRRRKWKVLERERESPAQRNLIGPDFKITAFLLFFLAICIHPSG